MLRKRKSRRSSKTELSEESGQTKTSARIDHAFVSSGDAPPAPKASKRRKAVYWIKHHKRELLIGAAVVMVSVAAFIVFWPGPASEPAAKGCSRELVREARSALMPSEVDRLQPVAQQMEASDGYDNDPNCVYVVLTYYINVSDGEKATQLYNRLVQVYNPDEGYDESIASRAQSPEEVRSTVEFLQSTAEDFHGQFGGLADEE